MIIELIIKWAVPFILTTIFAFLTKSIKDIKNIKDIEHKELTHIKASMLVMVRTQLIEKSEHYLNLGFLPDYARICIQELLDNYEELGGNHGINKLVEQCFNLPPNEFKYGRRKEDI